MWWKSSLSDLSDRKDPKQCFFNAPLEQPNQVQQFFLCVSEIDYLGKVTECHAHEMKGTLKEIKETSIGGKPDLEDWLRVKHTWTS